jgi:hypothetical protein
VQVNLYGPPVPGPSIGLDPKPTGLSPSSASGGQQVTVAGFNFGAAPGTVTVGGLAQGVAGWGDQAIAFAVSPEADGGAVAITRADGVSAGAFNLAVVPRLDRLQGNNLPAGSQVVVDGISLGAAMGRAELGPATAQVLLWSRGSVLLQVPAGTAPGTYPLVVFTAAGVPSNPLDLTVVAGPPPRAGDRAASAPAGIAGALAPSFDNSHQFQKPIKPPSPVYFNVSTNPHRVRGGEAAEVTVTLKLNDKPVSGAEVRLAMLFTPGADYRFTPASGVTDQNGEFKATVRVSKNPGDSVIAATSGVFSDQDHVIGVGPDGRSATAARGPGLPLTGGLAPLVLLGMAALALVSAGLYLNVRSLRA